MTILSKRALAAVAIATLAPLTACGSAGSGSATPSLRVSMAPAPAPGTILSSAQVTALVDAAYANLTSVHESLSINTSVVPTIGEGDLVKDASGLKVQMTLKAPSVAPIELRVVGQGLYLKNLPRSGGKWVKLDPNDRRNPTVQTFGALTAISPAQMYSQYQGGVTEATSLGADATGDHYQVVINTAQALAHLPASLASNPAITQGMKGLPNTVRFNLWIKGGLLQQTLLDLGTAGSVTAKFTNYGEQVDVQVPPTAQMTSIPGLG